MGFVKKCKKVWGSSKRRLHPEDSSASTSSGSYGKLSEKQSEKKMKMPPQGCIAVYVGPERQRFVIKIKLANHPLFMKLLEDAENEYGYRNDGPLWLPCDVDLFFEALGEIESRENDSSFPKGHRHSSSVFNSPILTCRSNMSYVDYELLV